MSGQNIYLPYLMCIEKITEEAPSVKTFKLKFVDKEDAKKFSYLGGFAVLSVKALFSCAIFSTADEHG